MFDQEASKHLDRRQNGERSDSMVEWLIPDPGVVGSSLTGVTAPCP